MAKKKENLAWKLNALQAQSGDVNGLTIQRAKYATRGKNAEKGNSKQIVRQLQETKKTMASNKVHYGKKQLNRAIKAVVKIEKLKLMKRIKRSGESAETTQLKSDLQKVNAEQCAEQLLNQICSEDMFAEFKEYLPEIPYSAGSSVLFEKLTSHKSVEEAGNNFRESLKKVFGLSMADRSNKHGRNVESTETTKHKPEGKLHQNEQVLSAAASREFEDADSESEDNESELEDADSESEDIGSGDDNEELGESGDEMFDLPSKRKHEDLESGDEQEKFTDEDENDDKYNLPELTAGYISGSEGSDPEDELVNDLVKQPRKNRRGQRARQRIWELKYGKKARHIQKSKEAEMDERLKNRLAFEERQAKRQKKEQEELTVAKEKFASKANGANMSDDSLKTNKKDKKEQELHPSWAAKKQQKVIAPFKGKKITFD